MIEIQKHEMYSTNTKNDTLQLKNKINTDYETQVDKTMDKFRHI